MDTAFGLFASEQVLHNVPAGELSTQNRHSFVLTNYAFCVATVESVMFADIVWVCDVFGAVSRM